MISLLEMLRYDAKKFALLQRVLTQASAETKAVERAVPSYAAVDADLEPEKREKYRDFYSKVLNELNDLNLPCSADQVTRVMRLLDSDKSWRNYLSAIEELQRRIEDEISHHVLLQIPPNKKEFYEKPELFGRAVYEGFPSAIVDIEEAGTCYALERNVACVMHLQRAIEVALKTLGAKIGVDITQNRTWDAILEKIDPELRKGYAERSDFFKSNLEECAEAAALLRSVKIAWRNPSMHVGAIYDDTKALDVMNAIKALMRHLASFTKEEAKQ